MVETRKAKITRTIEAAIQPAVLEIVDESHRHHVPRGAESHFKVTVVSEQFSDKRLIERHRKINQLLQEEFDLGLHALSIHAYTASEWQARQQKSRPSPACRDGFDK